MPYQDPGCVPSPVPPHTSDCNRPTVWPCPGGTWEPGRSGCASPECSRYCNSFQHCQGGQGDRLNQGDLRNRKYERKVKKVEFYFDMLTQNSPDIVIAERNLYLNCITKCNAL